MNNKAPTPSKGNGNRTYSVLQDVIKTEAANISLSLILMQSHMMTKSIPELNHVQKTLLFWSFMIKFEHEPIAGAQEKY